MVKTLMLMFIMLLTLTCSCAFADGPWKGKILDIETKEPLEGAVVLAFWNRIYRTPFGTSSYFYEAKEAVTNKAGEFEIPSYIPINLLPIISYMQGPEFIVFKPGYGSLRMAFSKYLLGETTNAYEGVVNGKMIRVTKGVIEITRLNTWEDRNIADMVSLGDVPKNKWPLLNALIEDEDLWLKNNKGWRR